MLIASISAMGTFYPEANPALQGSDLFQRDIALRNRQIFRILGKMPTIAANSYRHRIGRAYNQPSQPREPSPLSYTENFLYMLDHLSEKNFKPHPVFVKALDKIWILHAEHSLNCSTATMRQLASTLVDPYSCVAGASAALDGPLHGGANEAVLRMLERIGKVENVPKFIEEVKTKKTKLFGFGHRIYKNYDPRAKILKDIAYEVFEVTGTNPLLSIALELEKAALTDQYFIERKLYPNVDFYSGLIFQAMGFPTDMFPVLFSIPRAAGWLAHWCESLDDKETKIYRPKQIYSGKKPGLKYVPVEKRSKEAKNPQQYEHSAFFRRRELGTRSKL
jgi:citrate synthase